MAGVEGVESNVIDHKQPKVPSVTDLHWPTLEALRALGGSATKHEIDARVIDDLALTPAQLQVLEGDGPHTQATKRLAWARTHLGKIGGLTPDGHGLWTSLRGALLSPLRTSRQSPRSSARSIRSVKAGLVEEAIGVKLGRQE
ncbi:winged helix-turn-helix domain-containing protein [Candidatus Dormiibacter inghamiae]|uniref:winged helix-turn-helix domain-containing protein n=1 Tax=Candidatus Dormiibacter inghamiae TaxID=3127013 RepID=UPI0033130021